MTFALRPTYRRLVALNRQPKLEHFDNIYGAYCLKRVLVAYAAGPLVRLRRVSDNAEQDFAAGQDGWISAAEITAWLAGSSATVVTVYDQSGNSRPFTQATAADQPALDLSGSHPRMVMAAATGEWLVGTATLAGFARAQAAVSAVNVRIHDSTAGTQTVLWISDGAGINGVRVRFQVAGGNLNASVRVIDGGAVTQLTDGAASTATWITQAASWNVGAGTARHEINGVVATGSPTASNFSNTDSVGVFWGSRNSGDLSSIKTTALLLFRDALTISEMAAVNGFCEDLKAA